MTPGAAASRRTVLLMVGVALLMILPGLVTESHALAGPSTPGAPPALDRFREAVRAATPPQARLLAAGDPPALTSYRATYLLYPRYVYSATSTDYAHAALAPHLRWTDLLRLAGRVHARYVLLWQLGGMPRAAVRLRVDGGMLAEIPGE